MRKILSVALLMGLIPTLAAAPLYIATEIKPTLNTPLVAAALNNNGDIAGWSGDSAVVYLHHSKTVYHLPRPEPGSSDSATAINDYGKIGGASASVAHPPQATVWYLHGGSEMLPDGAASFVNGVSNDGQVIVTGEFYHGNSFGALWSWKPTLHEIPIPSFFDFNCCYPSSSANAINNLSHIVGESTLSQFTETGSQDFIEGDHAYLYANEKLTDLGVLGNPNPSDSLGASVAYGLNNRDDVVGQSDVDLLSRDPDCPGCIVTHAFLWHRGKLTDLGNLGHVPHWNSSATAINDDGEIVGSADANVANRPITRAFVYVDRMMYNLTFMVYHRDLNVRLVDAVGINCHGWIVANGYDTTDPAVNRVYLLIPKERPRRTGCPIPR